MFNFVIISSLFLFILNPRQVVDHLVDVNEEYMEDQE